MYSTIHVGINIKINALLQVSQYLLENYNIIMFFSPSIMGTMDPVCYVKFVEIVSRDHETPKKKVLELIRPIQDHFLMTWVQKFSGFRFRWPKHT